MSVLGFVLLALGLLVAWKVTFFFIRLLMIGVALVGAWLLLAPLLGGA